MEDNKNNKIAVTLIGSTDIDNCADAIKNVNRYSEMGENLSKLNTSRGGSNFKGFTFEELAAANETVLNGNHTVVLNNNGPADLLMISTNGNSTLIQAKTGYQNNSAGFKYNDCPTVLVDEGNVKLINEARQAGKKVIESNISDSEADLIAKAMQLESKITSSENSVFVSNTVSAMKSLGQIHKSGLNAAGKGGAAGGGFSLGSNIVEVISGDKSLKDATADVAIDTVLSASVGYGIGAATTAIGSTAAGTALSSAAVAAGTAVTTAVGSTAAGAALLGTTAAIGTTAASGAAAISTGTAAVLGTAAAGTVAGAAIIAAAPIVVASVAIGVIFTGLSKIFD